MTGEVALRPWQYSVKVEVNARGFVQPSVHVYSDEDRDLWLKATTLLTELVDELKATGYKVATSLPAANTDIKEKAE